jgi:hypothetical protein
MPALPPRHAALFHRYARTLSFVMPAPAGIQYAPASRATATSWVLGPRLRGDDGGASRTDDDGVTQLPRAPGFRARLTLSP